MAALTPASTTSPSPTTRPAGPGDAAAIASIQSQGIEERSATFETEPRRPEDVAAKIEGGELYLVAELAGAVVGYVSVSPYSTRPAYAGVGEFTIYVDRAARGQGLGGLLLDEVVAAAEARGMHKLLGRLFTTNEQSIALSHQHGFTDVGVHSRHAQLDGQWKDVLVVERLIGPAAR